jgi:hypothetical protein
VVTHACNPSYSGGGDWEDRGSRPAQVSEIPIATNNPGEVAFACLPATQDVSRQSRQSGWAWAKNIRPYPKNNKAKASGHGSSDRASA